MGSANSSYDQPKITTFVFGAYQWMQIKWNINHLWPGCINVEEYEHMWMWTHTYTQTFTVLLHTLRELKLEIYLYTLEHESTSSLSGFFSLLKFLHFWRWLKNMSNNSWCFSVKLNNPWVIWEQFCRIRSVPKWSPALLKINVYSVLRRLRSWRALPSHYLGTRISHQKAVWWE